MTLAVKTRATNHLIEQTAYHIYRAFRIGAGIHATGRPYPVLAWDDMKHCDQERYRNRAIAFDQSRLRHPLGEALFAAWHVDMNVTQWNTLPLGLRELWWDVAEAYRQIEREGRAAA